MFTPNGVAKNETPAQGRGLQRGAAYIRPVKRRQGQHSECGAQINGAKWLTPTEASEVHHPIERLMLPVLDLDPILRPASAIRSIAALEQYLSPP
jgi:hypothetical protein